MPAKGQILIVDDSEDNVLYLSQILRHYGYEFSVARNGEEALEAMKADRPDLVLLDIMMPKTSGVGVFREMRSDPALETVPVLIVSGASMVTGVDIETGEQRPKTGYKEDFALAFGTLLSETLQGLTPDGFVEKPVHPPTLVAKIKELLA